MTLHSFSEGIGIGVSFGEQLGSTHLGAHNLPSPNTFRRPAVPSAHPPSAPSQPLTASPLRPPSSS